MVGFFSPKTWHKSTPNLLYDIIRNIAVIIPERGEYGGSR